MRNLTEKEIEKFANRKGVKKIAVENFLFSMGINSFNAWRNLSLDAGLYKWNNDTTKAIYDGIVLAEY